MICKISLQKAYNYINCSFNVPAKIKAECILKAYPETPVFSDGESAIIIFGERGFVFGESRDNEELTCFLRFNGVKSVEGEVRGLNGEKRSYSVMEADGGGKEIKREKIEPLARLIAKTFSLDFSSLYSDLCRRVNLSVSEVFGNEFSAAAIHKGESGNLLWGVSVDESERGKGRGRETVEGAIAHSKGKLYAVCEERLEPFYEKCGFSKLGSLVEINIEE